MTKMGDSKLKAHNRLRKVLMLAVVFQKCAINHICIQKVACSFFRKDDGTKAQDDQAHDLESAQLPDQEYDRDGTMPTTCDQWTALADRILGH